MTSDDILRVLREKHDAGEPLAASTELARRLPYSWATIKRHLEQLVADGKVLRLGKSRATRYCIVKPATIAPQNSLISKTGNIVWSKEGLALRETLTQPLGAREIVTYDRKFVDDYVPNQSSLLPAALAGDLAAAGGMKDRQPAGTYARKVLEQLLIDLSWSSSRLEGNRYSLLATEELFKSGAAAGDTDAVMLLNHKAAIEFLVDAVPEYGLTTAIVRNLHAVLMQDLLADANSLGNIRHKVINISDSTYLPTQLPSLLKEMLEQIIVKATQVKNPVEAAFFLWVNLAYLQPFEDGNKRTSRLAANVPLMLYNNAPLSFLDVELQDYALAMMAVYEQRDLALAVDLFEWAYRRSIKKYAVTLEAMGLPDPIRVKFREALNEAIGSIVRDRASFENAVAALDLHADQEENFRQLLDAELNVLSTFNCARYRLTLGHVGRWIEAGRPR